MSRPTRDEIKSEIAALKALKPCGPYTEKTAKDIELLIEELETGIDQTSGEWEEFTEGQQDMVEAAHGWKIGLVKHRPSQGWEGLVE